MGWLHDWYVTLRYGREARRVLKESFNPDDYVEAVRPQQQNCIHWCCILNEKTCPCGIFCECCNPEA